MEFITVQDQKFLVIERSRAIDENILKRNWWNIEAIIKNGDIYIYCQGVHDVQLVE
jgi:hypothetical protein